MTAPNLFTRDDTFFGVCQGLGEDLGFDPNWLRVALAVALFWNPVAVAVGYLAAGLVVAVSRWAFPARRAAAVTVVVAPPAPVAVERKVEAEPVELPLAA